MKQAPAIGAHSLEGEVEGGRQPSQARLQFFKKGALRCVGGHPPLAPPLSPSNAAAMSSVGCALGSSSSPVVRLEEGGGLLGRDRLRWDIQGRSWPSLPGDFLCCVALFEAAKEACPAGPRPPPPAPLAPPPLLPSLCSNPALPQAAIIHAKHCGAPRWPHSGARMAVVGRELLHPSVSRRKP